MNKRITCLALLALLLLLAACAPATTDAPAANAGESNSPAESIVVYRSPT